MIFILGQINPAKSFCGKPRFLHADIVRKAQAELKVPNTVMIKTDDWISSAGLDVKMIMQVHDELVFEIAEADVNKARQQIENCMTTKT